MPVKLKTHQKKCKKTLHVGCMDHKYKANCEDGSHRHNVRISSCSLVNMPKNLDFYEILRKVNNNKLLLPQTCL